MLTTSFETSPICAACMICTRSKAGGTAVTAAGLAAAASCSKSALKAASAFIIAAQSSSAAVLADSNLLAMFEIFVRPRS